MLNIKLFERITKLISDGRKLNSEVSQQFIDLAGEYNKNIVPKMNNISEHNNDKKYDQEIHTLYTELDEFLMKVYALNFPETWNKTYGNGVRKFIESQSTEPEEYFGSIHRFLTQGNNKDDNN